MYSCVFYIILCYSMWSYCYKCICHRDAIWLMNKQIYSGGSRGIALPKPYTSIFILYLRRTNETRRAYVIMLFKRWTSMIMWANVFQNASVIKKIYLNANIRIPKNFHFNEKLTMFKFWWFFLFVEAVWICC